MQKGIDYTGVTVTFFCHDGKGRFLMAKRSKNCRDEVGNWDIGGGGVEFGDNVEERLRTEVMEEYCSPILQYEYLGYRDVHRELNGKPTHWISLCFKVLVDPKKVKNGEPHKMEEIQWFTFDTLPSPLHSQAPAFFEKYKKQLGYT